MAGTRSDRRPYIQNLSFFPAIFLPLFLVGAPTIFGKGIFSRIQKYFQLSPKLKLIFRNPRSQPKFYCTATKKICRQISGRIPFFTQFKYSEYSVLIIYQDSKSFPIQFRVNRFGDTFG
ncbi:hypothetical protein CH360_17405 [Leptospira perolatii]|uniref:Uncharacterized protein n=1 Tax=Leptospira perolatii TaxID=2023191 RepID=A0ABX4P579_9LEPT|nr:hypothetical protein CH360_17405 [Leptospira perolatii]